MNSNQARRRVALLLAVVTASGVAAGGTLAARSEHDAVRRQVAPGIGANTEDPRKILRAAAEALRALHSVAYDCRYRGVGAFATRTATVVAKAAIAKLAPGDPLVAKMAVEGTFAQSGTADAVGFRTAFDGHVVRKLNAQTKVIIERNVDTDPAARTLAGVTMMFGGGAFQALLFDYVRDNPLSRQLDATVAEYEGRTNVGGVLCHVVYLEIRLPNGRVTRERWFIGVADCLPREFESVAVDDLGRYGAYVLTLSDVRPNPHLDTDTFAVSQPAGYVVKAYEPPNRPALLNVGGPAPDWTLMDADGRAHTLADYRGKLVVLDFWATWCGPCVQAMPGLQKLHEKYHDRGVEIIGINAWEESNAAAYMKERGYTYQLLLKGETVAEAYRASVLPTVYVIGPNGTIIYRGTSTDANTLASVIDEHLKGRDCVPPAPTWIPPEPRWTCEPLRSSRGS